ncbi:tetratricopeptide repeat protein [Herpetosiphon gulosus]
MLPDVPNKQQRADFRWYFDDYLKWPFLEFRTRAARVEADLVAVGKALFLTIFASSSAATKIYDEWISVDHGIPTLQILSLIPAVLSIPWELLHDDYGFLNQRRLNPVAIYRIAKTIPSTILRHQFAMPLRVLVVIARPDDVEFLDPRTSAQTILAQLQHLERDNKIKPGMIEFEFLRPPTYDQLARRLQNATKPVHVLHFDGHGGFSNLQHGSPYESMAFKAAHTNQGVLAFETADHHLNIVHASDFAKLLNGAGVRLVLLDACQTSVMDTSESDDTDYQRQQALGSVATQLLAAGVPAVVAMSASVVPMTTALFFGEFYGLIAKGQSVPLALERARQALQSQPVRLYLSQNPDKDAESITLEDWWLPHFYQQREINLIPTGKPRRPKPAKLSGFVENPLQRPFVGRAKELLHLERALLNGKIVLLHGFGGIGKTRLASEAAAWLTQTKLYHGALLLSFEHGGSHIALLSAIARHYALPETDSHDLQAAVQRFKPHLRSKPLLIIADNLESILPNAGNAELNVLDANERHTLWDCVLSLRQAGAGMILTCRDFDLRDSRLQQGPFTHLVPMRGLDAPAAYRFATALLDDLAIDRRRAPKLQLSTLLARLDHHPLAMGLTLRALREPSLSIEQLLSDYCSLLARFTDETDQNQRHHSLDASLTYSLQRLSPDQREWLARLAPFEGGALELFLLEITKIPAVQWPQLRVALEHAALIQVELLGGGLVFLRFHPTLTPYIRRQYRSPNDLEQRFVECYCELLEESRLEDTQHSQATRVLVQYELPNLQRTIQRLLALNEINAAVVRIINLNHFYYIFGMQRERNLLNQQLAQHMSSSKQLSENEYLHESELGNAEFVQGNYNGALQRFQQLLIRIVHQPSGQSYGLGSYTHCLTLSQIGDCLLKLGSILEAQDIYQQALIMIERLSAQQKDNRFYIRQQAILLARLADCNVDEGQFKQAQLFYEQAIDIFQRLDDLQSQAVTLVQLGTLSLQQHIYNEANQRYHEALNIYQRLKEPKGEATINHQLGRVAEKQEDWLKAEQYYRQSLIIKEKLNDSLGIATTCSQLAIVAQFLGNPDEAENWYQRALKIPHIPILYYAHWLSNLANLIVTQVETGNWACNRLTEAQGYAEEVLRIKEMLDPSRTEIWTTFGILADIAKLVDLSDQASHYRQQARIAYISHNGNRWHINRQFGQLIAEIVAATQGDQKYRTILTAEFSKMQKNNGINLLEVIHRIWAGERDWQSLCSDLNNQYSLLIVRVIEELEEKRQK